MPKAKKVVLAYSGGLDTSAIVPWLVENLGCEVYAYVADVGQGSDELAGVEEKALASGAKACKVYDLREELVTDYIWPTIQAGAIYEGRYLLGTAIARPLISKYQVEYAREVGADAVSHGCTGKGNDQVRFEAGFAALAPDLAVIAPWRHWDMSGRSELLAYLSERNIPCSASVEKIYSRDRNLWHISHEGGSIEDPWSPPPQDAWQLSEDPASAPDNPEHVTLTFDKGVPVKLNGEPIGGVELIEQLNEIAGAHGVGRIDLVESRTVGMKSRGLYETPGGTVIVEAMRGLEEVTLDRETLRFRQELGLRFADLVYGGRWFTPLREALSVCATSIASRVTGEVVVRLFKGTALTVQRSAPKSYYSEALASFEANNTYDQKDAAGFIKLLTLPERVAALQDLPASSEAELIEVRDAVHQGDKSEAAVG
ncbi:MAG: argininosuccinate synthase [Planctomycetota bacterium]